MTESTDKGLHNRARRLGAAEFDLEDFFPYQVSQFYAHVTTALARCYSESYDMSPPEWRITAILGPERELTSVQIVSLSQMDKVTVSRAVAKMIKRDWLTSRSHNDDRRSKLLRLSVSGCAIYRALIPDVLAAEAALLRGLSAKQISELKSLMTHICGNHL